jgi:tRNA pseudouridine55 synthase
MPGGRSQGPRVGRVEEGAANGILNIDKPAGPTSMEVVRRIKRACRQKRVGHGGTLDPLATGVIPICIGQATRMMEYLIEGTREYRGSVELGVETDTYDALGEVVGRSDASSVTTAVLEDALESFRGTIQQVPPMYSALKRQGKRLYELARAGIEVERKPRTVETLSLSVLEWSPPHVTLDVTCGRGFYMRSLAHDLGQVLGCGGHLTSLTRLRDGPFKLSDALTLDEAEQRLADEDLEDMLYPPDEVVREMRAAIVGERLVRMIRNGRSLPGGLRIPFSRPDEQCRVYGTDGSFLAIMSFKAGQGQWQTDKVFPQVGTGGDAS